MVSLKNTMFLCNGYNKEQNKLYRYFYNKQTKEVIEDSESGSIVVSYAIDWCEAIQWLWDNK